MTKTIDGVTYELVASRIPRSDVIDCNCGHCAASGSVALCKALGDACIGKGVWKSIEATHTRNA